MAKKSFMKVNGLSDEIIHRAKKALNNEVKDYVVDRLKRAFEKKSTTRTPLLNTNVVKVITA